MSNVEERNIKTIRRLYEEALNQNQQTVLDDVFTDGVLYHGVTEEQGAEAARTAIGRVRVAFPDQQFRLEDVIANDDRVVVRWTMQATHSGPLAGIPATGKRVQQRAIVIYRFADGRIAEVWPQMDQVGMLRQLGVSTLPAIPGAPART